MSFLVDDARGVERPQLDDRIVEFRMAPTLGIVETIMVDFRLGMMMGRIGRPASRQGQNLAQDEIRIGIGIVIAENGPHHPLAGTPHLPCATKFVGYLARLVYLSGE